MKISSSINMYNKDCLPDMKNMLDNKYDLAIVDTPYGIDDWNKRGSNKRRQKGIDSEKTKSWDIKPNKEYFAELLRVSKAQIIWGANHFISRLFDTKAMIVWDKRQDGMHFNHCELAWCNNLNQSINIFRLGSWLEKNRFHPTQKPVQLYKWLLKNYGFNKDGSKRTILDTHGGSMSSVIACLDLGFDIDCWEIDKDYFEDAQKRINKHKKKVKLRLFKTGIYYENK